MATVRSIKSNIKELKRKLKKEEEKLKVVDKNRLIGIMSTNHRVEMEFNNLSGEKLFLNKSDKTKLKYNFVYKQEGFKTVCIMTCDDMPEVKGVGVARCNPDIDKHDMDFGIVLSNLRAKKDFYDKLSTKYIDDYYDFIEFEEEIINALGGE